MFSKITYTLLLLFVITNLSACGNNTTKGDSNEKTISDSFLKLIASGKTEEAWDSTSAEFKSYMGKAQFQSTVGANPFLKKEVTFGKAEKDEKTKILTYCSYKESKSNKTVVVIVGPDPDALRVQGMKIE
ncbi:MAG: hypothetical protein NTZ30_16150 [Planctomycetota bacterium]|nr:hypothetical protein [Planctomycetota bacterium]